ncbi:MAG: glycosyltransferase family 2 protein [Leptolyngbyaceae cyanobacterium HOT.MB2.61]|jgi:glycosyltransferase involved in cell wall biosynthesis|nr:glycosyltransferase family 2 protein [Leptolyngbyaceae cyanobacterium HOT.MB2.61]
MTLVTVIIPMRNAEPYIAGTLASILDEQDIPLEVVVVNDGSTDCSVEKVEAIADPRVRIIPGPCKGFAESANTGWAAAKGEIIMRSDADDLFPKGRIKRQVEWLTRHPEFGAVCGGFAMIDAKDRIISKFCESQEEEITEELKQGVTRNHFCTYAIRAEVLKASGGCRSCLANAADIDLQLRVGELCRVWYLPEIEYFYRLHDSSITRKQRIAERVFFDSLVIELQRQRLSRGFDDVQMGYIPVPPPNIDHAVMTAGEQKQGMLVGRSWQEHQSGQKLQALRTGIWAVAVRPQSLSAWRSLLALVVKPTGSVKSG